MRRDSGDRLNVRRWLPPLLWAGVILIGTSLPGSLVPRQVSAFDKALHFTVYAILAVLLTKQISEVTGRWRAAVLAIALTAAFGAADEWHQGFIPGRSQELADWRADALGATLGALAAAVARRANRPEAAAAQ
jgi:VanZ family protein